MLNRRERGEAAHENVILLCEIQFCFRPLSNKRKARKSDFIKDYYKILSVEREASAEEIKKSFRLLAHHFHPDKNPDNTFASDYFLEIQEAYKILSAPAMRKAYDRERYLAGLDRQNEPVVSPQSLLRQAQKLSDDVRRMTAYRVDIPWLQSALVFLLSKQHLAVLSQPGMLPLRKAFVREITAAIKVLPYPFPVEITRPLNQLVAKDEDTKGNWESFLAARKNKFVFQKIIPWLAVLITLVLCGLMYWYGKR